MNTLQALIKFLHQACFSTVINTWCKAIDTGFFTTCPGLISSLVRKHLPKSIETEKGHLKMACQHVRSTRTQPPLPPTQPAHPIHQPIMMEGILHTENLIEKTWCVWGWSRCCARFFSDQTRRFPRVSSRGNIPAMVLYDYNSNAIKNRDLKKLNNPIFGEGPDQPNPIPLSPGPETHGPPHWQPVPWFPSKVPSEQTLLISRSDHEMTTTKIKPRRRYTHGSENY